MKVTALHQTLKDISLDSDVLNVAVVMAPRVQVASALLREVAIVALECVDVVVAAGVLFVATVVCISTASLMTNVVVQEAFFPLLAFL